MIDFSAGQPLGPTQVQQLFEKINRMCDGLSDTLSTVRCDPVNSELSNNECLELPNPLGASNENNAGIIDQKILLLTIVPSLGVNLSGRESDGNPTPTFKLNVKCGGVEIYAGQTTTNPNPTTLQIQAMCPRDQDLEICVETGLIGANQFTTADSTVSVCGALICVGEVKRENTGLFKIPDIPAGCCYGREAIMLAAQNVCAIGQELVRNRDQLSTLETLDISGTGNGVLAANLPSQTEYLVVGQIEVCYRNTNRFFPFTLTVNPGVGCASSPADCLGYSQYVPESDGFMNPVRCLVVPVIACGVCPPGEDILAGLTLDQECIQDQVAIEGGVGLEIVSVEQKYCAWLFSRADVSSIPPVLDFNLSRCLTDAALLPLQEKCETVESFLESRRGQNLTVRDIGPSSGLSGTLSGGLQQALAWPPPTPPPRPVPDPPPVKAWTVTINACIFYNQALENLIREIRFQNVLGYLLLEIRCGSDVVATVGPTEWVIKLFDGQDEQGITTYDEQCLVFSGCIECAIDQGLTYRITANTTGALNEPLGIDVTQASMFCF